MGKLRRRRSRSRLSSCLLERRDLELSRSYLWDTPRRWAALTQAASGLQSTVCRMERTLLSLRRSLLGTRRWGQKGLVSSKNCLLRRVCRTPGW